MIWVSLGVNSLVLLNVWRLRRKNSAQHNQTRKHIVKALADHRRIQDWQGKDV